MNRIRIPIAESDKVRSNSNAAPSSISNSRSMDMSFFPDGIDFDLDHQNNLSNSILCSENYKQAYALFKEAGAYGEKYLTMLKSIPGKYVSATQAWWESAFKSNKAAEADRLSYQAAMTEIGNLISSYFEFVNTLPEEQAEQLKQIGYNLGLSGDVSGSQLSMPESQPVDFNAAGSATELIQGVGTAVNAIVSLVNASVAIGNLLHQSISSARDFSLRKKLQNFTIDKDKKSLVLGFSNLLRSQGYVDASNAVLDNGYEGLLYNVFDPKLKVDSNKNIVEYIKSIGLDEQVINNYLVPSDDGSIAYDTNKILSDMYDIDSSQYLNFGDGIIKVIDEQSEYTLKSHLFDLKKKYYQSKYSADYSAIVDGSDAGKSENLRVEYDSKMREYSIEELKFKTMQLQKWVNDYSNTKDPVAKRFLYESIMEISSDTLFLDQLFEFGEDIFRGDMTSENFLSSLLMFGLAVR